MPAYRERIYLCPEQNGRPIWIGEFPVWWDRGEFFKKYGDRLLDTGNPFYVDYGLLLTQGEASAWDKQCREAFSREPHRRQSEIAASMELFETLLKNARWVIVESYEWESGLA